MAPPAGESDPDENGRLSTADHAAAFATGREPIDRAAALRAGSTPVPRKVIVWIIVGFAILGLGGVIGEHFGGNVGQGSQTTEPTTLAGTSNTAPPTPAPPSAPPITTSLNAFIGLTRLAGDRAPAVSLRDQSGAPWTLDQARGKVVVLAFFNSECNDICPVLAKEIVQANELLGTRSANVDFVVVNTDPRETSLAPTPPALTETGLGGLANVTFLDGRLSALNTIWKKYGVTVTVGGTPRVVTHNDVMYFINPEGRLTLRATPFANEDQLGIYNLDPADTQRFAQGMTNSAISVLGGQS